MSRYTGPRLKVMRALGLDLPGLSRKTIADRPHRPGQHGLKPQRLSDFGAKLMEKQKLRFNYGLTEGQLRRLVSEAKRSKTPTGDKLLELLERRFDNAVFRAGFAPTIPAARQLVRHGHLRLNGRRVDLPGVRLKIGDTITLHRSDKPLDAIRASLAEPALTRPEWLTWDETAQSARVGHLPGPQDVPFPIEMQQVVEYYALRG
ncbi:30S ribosomal protein S4 [Oryzomicrobium sp.]|uniref:30S ribosomal protein S4 n=1 Tax=Oryzomicrobium sp. TaxID=1911578 RepID=UPI002FE19D9D